MDFFTKHDASLRKGRLLQAAAQLFVFYRSLSLKVDPESGPIQAREDAVKSALALEEDIENALDI